MKVKTLSTSFLVLSYAVFILVQILISVVVRFEFSYFGMLVFHFISVFLLGYISTGTLVVDFQNEKEIIVTDENFKSHGITHVEYEDAFFED